MAVCGSPTVVKLGRYAAAGMGHVIQVLTVFLLVSVAPQKLNHTNLVFCQFNNFYSIISLFISEIFKCIILFTHTHTHVVLYISVAYLFKHNFYHLIDILFIYFFKFI